ncbi:MORN repeat-containing protein [Zoogloea sp.]|uniref:MORN repeat-containing protein n=1 Tax=Zoogloea sp. TaxID=49181 RepID=UPI0035AD8330
MMMRPKMPMFRLDACFSALLLGCALPVAAQGDALLPESSGGAGADCPVLLQEAEAGGERGRELLAVRRWKDALPLLREASRQFGRVGAECAAQAPQAQRQGEQVLQALRQAEAQVTHQTECQPRLDKALELEVRVAAARAEQAEPAALERLFAEVETLWREASSLCLPPNREKAERNLAATIRQRAANAELLSAGPACDAAWKSAGALVDYARSAWREKRWEDASALYGKAVLGWEGAADKCTGPRQQQAQRKAEQTQVDAHNAEFCGPLWEAATDLSQRYKGAVTAPASERDGLSIRAEVAWREAASQCRGTPQSQARNNADALARERGAPLPPQAMSQYASRKAGPVPAAAAPVATHTAAQAAPASTTSSATSSAVAGAAPAATTPAAAPARSGAQAPASSAALVAPTAPQAPAEGVLVAGDTTYTGRFTPDPVSGIVSGTGRVEWANGESFQGTLVNGVRQGRGRFNWTTGQWYEGDWQEGRALGQGTIQFPGGNRYEGAVQDGQPHGRGVMVFASGDRYTGDFVRGVFHGRGNYLWKNGNLYEGEWVMGRKHGQGRITWPGGDGWEGEFRDDQRTESGRVISAR